MVQVVRWRTWGELRASLNLIHLYETLPARQPHLPALAHRVQNSFCFNHTVYKYVAPRLALCSPFGSSWLGSSS